MKLTIASALFALLGILSLQFAPLHAADATAPKKIPFHGTLKAVDTSAQTITLESKKDANGRVFYLTATTKITDGSGNAATLATATVGEDVGGSYTKDASGKMMLNSVRFGAKSGSKSPASASATAATPPMTATPTPATSPAPEKAAPAPTTTTPEAAAATTATTAKPKRQSMTGKVTAVDASGNTLSVHGKSDQTFPISSTTKITGASNLGAIAVGAKVTVSYSKAADGTLTVTSVKVAK